VSSVADPKIRAVLTDVDGTLLGSDLAVSEANREAIVRATRAGVPVILATGRI
jgi:hydroxymethylpyrimidine pyrophosphatase-like HAD family hydrolase